MGGSQPVILVSGNNRLNLKIGLRNLNKLSFQISLVSTFLVEQTLHIFGVAQTCFLPSITDCFVDITDYFIVRKYISSQVTKHGVFIYIKKNIELMVNCPNVVCIRLVRLSIFVIMVYRPPSNSSEDNYHLSQFILKFFVDREVIINGDFNLPSNNWIMFLILFNVTSNLPPKRLLMLFFCLV